MNTHVKTIETAAAYIRGKLGGTADFAVVLGSGLAGVGERLELKRRMAYAEIPGFPSGVVQGQKGELLFGGFGGRDAILFSGRFHLYQGYSLQEVTLPIRVAKRLGVRVLVLTNASGGIRGDLDAGDLMLVTDHINLLGTNPLVGIDPGDFGPVFIDMTEPYSPRLIALARKVASDRPEIGGLSEGVYLATSGPSYETKAEIAFFSRIGADAVGMSTVPEVIVAAHEGIEVMGISVIANKAAGISGGKLSHGEVLAAMRKASSRLASLLMGVAAELRID